MPQNWVASSGKRTTPYIRQALTQHLNHTFMQCTARLGRTTLRMRQDLACPQAWSDLLVLDTEVNGELLTCLWKTRSGSRGKPAVRNRKLVVSITDVVKEE